MCSGFDSGFDSVWEEMIFYWTHIDLIRMTDTALKGSERDLEGKEGTKKRHSICISLIPLPYETT